MNSNQDWHNSKQEAELEELKATVWDIAQGYQANSRSLLALLRTLEHLHRKIREEMFEPSLPNTRRSLYLLLKEIEETGGWPYIERMKIQTFLHTLTLDPLPNETKEAEKAEVSEHPNS